MKSMYIQPTVQIVDMATTHVICGSAGSTFKPTGNSGLPDMPLGGGPAMPAPKRAIVSGI